MFGAKRIDRAEIVDVKSRGRKDVARTVIGWIEGYFQTPEEAPPSLGQIKTFL